MGKIFVLVFGVLGASVLCAEDQPKDDVSFDVRKLHKTRKLGFTPRKLGFTFH